MTLQTFPKQESCDCQNLIRREVERAGLVGLDGAIKMSGDPGSLLWNMWENRQGSLVFNCYRSWRTKCKKLFKNVFFLETQSEWFSFTGLFWDRTPTAGSQGRFSSSDRASALGAPVFADGSNILSMSEGNFPSTERGVKMNQECRACTDTAAHIWQNIHQFLLFIQFQIQYLAFESLQHIQVSSKHGKA